MSLEDVSAEVLVLYDIGEHLLNVRGIDSANVGHAIEFVGFALEHYGEMVPPARLAELEALLLASFRAGFAGPGIAPTR